MECFSWKDVGIMLIILIVVVPFTSGFIPAFYKTFKKQINKFRGVDEN